MPHCKGKLQHSTAHLFLLLSLQKIFHLSQKIHKLQRQRPYIFHYPVLILALPLIFQQNLITLFQNPLQLSAMLLHCFLHFQKILFTEHRAVHIPSPVYQVMGLVDQKQIIPLHAIPKKPLQIHIRIKHIIIITDHRVHPGGSIQTHLKRTHLPLPCLHKQFLPLIRVLLCQKLIHRVIHSVKMPIGIRTLLRITLHLIHQAHFFLGGDRECLIRQSFPFENRKRLLRHRPGDRLGCQIENLISIPFPHSPHSRKKGCR